MPFEKNNPNINSKNQTKGKTKKYSLVITNLPDGFNHNLVYWDDIWGDTYMKDYYSIDEIKEVITILPPQAKYKLYRCRITSERTPEDFDEGLEITLEM
jgi:hypothetical protein